MPQKEKIRTMFDGIAADYDRLNHIMSLDVDKRWRRKALSLVAGPDVRRVLDLACGTGDFSIAAAKALRAKAPEARVTGVDLSEGMLAVMKEKVAREGLEDMISMEIGDGENLHFGNGTFDRVSVAFGIRNFENREKGLREMLRVLRPGGRLVILELSVPENAFVRWCYNLYFLHILPLIGGRISGDKAAYRYLPASVLHFPGHRAFLQTMRECGFSDASHKALTFGICRLYTGTKPEA